MGILKPHVLKRAVFMFVILFPVLLILEYTGNTNAGLTAILAGILGGVSVIIFPDPKYLKKIEEVKNNEKSDK